MGPNTNDRELMRNLILNGMDVARFNFSHGDHEEQKGRMDMLKQLREELNANTAILLDTKGPEIRTGKLKDGKKVNDILKCQHLNAYRFAYNTFIDHSYPKVVTKLVFFAVYCNRFLHIIHVFSMLLYL